MDIQIKNYTFDKTAKTVTFTDYVTIRLDSVRIITNVESNIIIYNFAQSGLGGSVLNNVLTLDYDTSSMVNTDKLQIVYNDDEIKATESGIQAILTELKLKSDLTETQPVSLATSPLPTGAATAEKQDNQITLQTTLNSLVTAISSLIETNNTLAQKLEVLAGMANSGAPALRVAPISSVSTAVTGSLTTVTNLTNFGTGVPAKEVSDDMNNLVAVIANVNNVSV